MRSIIRVATRIQLVSSCSDIEQKKRSMLAIMSSANRLGER